MTAQRYPHHALPANPNGTALIIGPPPPPILTAQRHPQNALPTNPHGRAPPTRCLPPKSPRPSAAHATPSPPIIIWYNETHATRPPPIPTALNSRPYRDPTATSPPRAATNDAYKGPAPRPQTPRPPDYKWEPFAAHSRGKKIINQSCIGAAGDLYLDGFICGLKIGWEIISNNLLSSP